MSQCSPRPAQWVRCMTTAPRQTFIPALPPRESWLLPALAAPRAHSVTLPSRVDSACDRALEPFRPRQVGRTYETVPTPLAFRPHPAAFRSSVSHRGLPCYVFAMATVESPFSLPPPLLVGPGASPSSEVTSRPAEPTASPPESCHAVITPVSYRPPLPALLTERWCS
jgi:hypothetical protein